MKPIMRREDPPVNTRRSLTQTKREQLLANPNEWFVWNEKAKYAEYGHKTLRALMGVKPGDRFSRESCPYEVRVSKNNDGKTYKVYARYIEKGESL